MNAQTERETIGGLITEMDAVKKQIGALSSRCGPAILLASMLEEALSANQRCVALAEKCLSTTIRLNEIVTNTKEDAPSG